MYFALSNPLRMGLVSSVALPHFRLLTGLLTFFGKAAVENSMTFPHLEHVIRSVIRLEVLGSVECVTFPHGRLHL